MEDVEPQSATVFDVPTWQDERQGVSQHWQWRIVHGPDGVQWAEWLSDQEWEEVDRLLRAARGPEEVERVHGMSA